MAGPDITEPEKRKKRDSPDSSSSDAETASQTSKRSSKDKKKRRRRNKETNSSQDESEVGELKKIPKKKRKQSGGPNGSRRRPSLSLPPRDPRDLNGLVAAKPKKDGKETRSPSPMIDFDGLSRPSACCSPFATDRDIYADQQCVIRQGNPFATG